MPNVGLNAVVSQKINITPELIILRVVPDGWELPDFVPGQFAVLGLPVGSPRSELSDPEDAPPDEGKLIRRSYSIASSSIAREYVEFYITIVRSGALTPRLFALNPGDRVWLGRKFTGMFKLSNAPDDANIVMIATGTGLAPYMSMLRTHLEANENRKTALLHGARHSWDLGYRSELISLQRFAANFYYIPTISRPAEEPAPWPGKSGYVQDLWRGGVLEGVWVEKPRPDNTHIFLCGNPGMIEDMVKILGSEGFEEHKKTKPGQVHVERYW